jgi:hypothetical protein
MSEQPAVRTAEELDHGALYIIVCYTSEGNSYHVMWFASHASAFDKAREMTVLSAKWTARFNAEEQSARLADNSDAGFFESPPGRYLTDWRSANLTIARLEIGDPAWDWRGYEYVPEPVMCGARANEELERLGERLVARSQAVVVQVDPPPTRGDA